MPDVLLDVVEDSPGVSFLRAQYVLEIPLAEAKCLLTPELFFHSRRPEFDNEITGAEIQQFLAPGEAIAKVHWRFSPQFQRNVILTGTPRLSAAATMLQRRVNRVRGRLFSASSAGKAESDARDVWTGEHIGHWALRHDFPAPEECSVVFVPLHPETGELLEEWGLLKAHSARVRADPWDAGRIIVTEVKQLKRVPLWLLPSTGVAFLQQWTWLPAFRRSQLYSVAQHEMANGPWSFMVVALRKCSKGSPLLPVESDNDAKDREDSSQLSLLHSTEPADWRAADYEELPGNFTLSLYLQAFLRRALGGKTQHLKWKPSVPVSADGVAIYDTPVVDELVTFHNSLHGRKLVPYQAAIRRGAWDHIWPLALEGLWKTHKTAYRRCTSSRNAPELVVDVEPKFLAIGFAPESWESSRDRVQPQPDECCADSQRLRALQRCARYIFVAGAIIG